MGLVLALNPLPFAYENFFGLVSVHVGKRNGRSWFYVQEGLFSTLTYSGKAYWQLCELVVCYL